MSSPPDESVAILGIDLAWGEKNPDGFTILEFSGGLENPPTHMETVLTRGDDELFGKTKPFTICDRVMVAIDAPTICRNEEGSRPVDQECTREYRRYEAGCHPVNRRLCARPFRVAQRFEEEGFVLTTDPGTPRFVSEVYPHPATIRLFGLEKTIKYKKGKVAQKRAEFSRYQDYLAEFLAEEMPWLADSGPHCQLLSLPWTKNIEDQVDSILCAAIAYRHLKYHGEKSEVLGDDLDGHMLIPRSA
ncbi:MAG: DUF429 domain-containing protein [Verrucomicrobiales bacterium]|nr:DUF429 domain-containing protein [bacterium]MDF2376173.1 DUF429 domain-containing protein [Verrucomicrobiales bacterium]